METYGEFLFEAQSANVMDCLTGISEEDIKDCSDYKIFIRGREYYQDGLVEEISYNRSNNTITAVVAGTKNYQLEFYIEEDLVYGTCNCPYGDVCKHIVAVLLYVIHDGKETILEDQFPGPTTVESLDFLKDYLKSLPKKELIRLVMKFAPGGYITEVLNRKAPGIDAEAIFKKADKKIRKFFKDDELLYDPYSMEEALLKQLQTLKGLEERLQNEIGELILFIIRNVDDAFNEGYLYSDNYPDDDIFESEEFCEYIITFVKQLPFNEKRGYIIQLDQVLNEMSYDTFSVIEHSYHRFFENSEMNELKLFTYLDADLPLSIVSRLYAFLEPGLDDPEKEAMLRKIISEDPDHFTSLCRLLFRQERYQDTHELIKEQLSDKDHWIDREIIMIYLDVSNKLELDMQVVSREAVRRCPNLPILLKIKEIAGSVDRECEEIVKEYRAEDLLTFYEQENRMADALTLVNEPGLFYDGVIFSFFRQHRKLFPGETEAFLRDRIEKNLNSTGKSYYAKIAESLDLMKRVNPERTRRIADEIRTNFKRRSNLMSMIREF